MGAAHGLILMPVLLSYIGKSFTSDLCKIFLNEKDWPACGATCFSEP